MRIVDDFLTTPPFTLHQPVAVTTPACFNAPHSGTDYPRDLLRRSKLERQTLRRSEDTFVDDLFHCAVALGAPLLKANFPRVYVDANRHETELDPTMFEAPLGLTINYDSARVTGGLGVIARVVAEGQEIYDAPLPAPEAVRRLNMCYRPYHAALFDMLRHAIDLFGFAVLIDCHSMPSGAARGSEGGAAPDVIIGDRFGKSCAPAISDALVALLRAEGLRVGRNRPYAGGHITEHYGAIPGIHALQIEIDRGLYMDEATYRRTGGFADLQRTFANVCRGLVDWLAEDDRSGVPLAAE